MQVARRVNPGGRTMSQLEIKALETHFEVFKGDRYPSLSPSEAFERFAIVQILKDEDLSEDEIESGILGGGDDGGIDGMYFFVNRTLVQDETDIPEDAISARLVVAQAKYENGFAETAIVKMETFARDLLDYSRDVDKMNYLNANVRDAIRLFRSAYDRILGKKHSMTVSFAYASKSDQLANQKVLQRIENLRAYVRDQISYAKVDFEFWDCRKLLTAARRTPATTETIDFVREFTTNDGSAICLVKLGSLAALLRDENGEIRRAMLEPNVRDYQGEKNPTNTAIRETLQETNQPEFWWLNNGVTVLAKSCSVTGGKLIVERPEVVNGLQTSYEIFQHFKTQPDKADNRSVLVRVIVPPNEQMRTKIIRATNLQTPISEISLHATDPIHFDIEERLRLYQLFYERRKGEYREAKKPADQIVSMQTLARAVMAVVLQQPNNAYATPSRVLKNKNSFGQIFNHTYNRDLYVVCILIHRQVEKYLLSRGAELKDVRSIIRYYVTMTVVCELLKKTDSPTDKELAALLPTAQKGVDEKLLAECTELVWKAYKKEGESETIAKGPEMTATLKKWLADKFATKGTLV